jgi:hypothetical protein
MRNPERNPVAFQFCNARTVQKIRISWTMESRGDVKAYTPVSICRLGAVSGQIVLSFFSVF